MTVLASSAQMRRWFAVATTTVSGAADNGSGLVRLHVGSTSNLDHAVPMLVEGIVGTTEGNGLWFPIIVDGTHVDLPGSSFSNAYVSGGTVYNARDGFPDFPGPQAHDGTVSNAGTSKLRSGGFSSTFTVTTAGAHVWNPATVGAIGPLIAGPVPALDACFPLTVTCNAGASDGGSDSYAWWLSQRNDPGCYPSILQPGIIPTPNAPAVFTVTQLDGTHSGTVVIGVNAGEVTKLFPKSGGVPPTDAGSLLTLCMNVHLYVCRLSDRAFQCASLVNLTPPAGV